MTALAFDRETDWYSRETGWMTDALCVEVGPDLFFAGDNNSNPARLAKKVCALCPVTTDCLNYALTVRLPGGSVVDGVWGGTSEDERGRMRTEMRTAGLGRVA